MTYSTFVEFSNSTNSRKSLLSGIRMEAVAQFDCNLYPLFGRQLRVGLSVSGAGFGEAVEDADYLVHDSIVGRVDDGAGRSPRHFNSIGGRCG